MPSSWSRSPESRAIHPSRETKRWVRWFFRCGVPLEHIVIVLEVDLAAADDAVHCRNSKGRAWVIPTAPPHSGRVKKTSAILGPAARHVRRLAELGYPPSAIATILDVTAAAVGDLLRRCVPIRRAVLVRPREPSQQRALRPPRPRPWRLIDARSLDGPNRGDPPPIAPAVEVLRQVEVPPPASNPWEGPTTTDATGETHGRHRLTWELVREIRRRHAAGESCYAMARQYNVHRGTIRAVVTNLTWIEDAPDPSPALPATDAPSDAPCSETRQKQGSDSE